MDLSQNHQTVFRFGVFHRVSAENGNTGLTAFVLGALENLLQHSNGQTDGGEADDIQGKQRGSSHGVDVAEGVGGGNGAEVIRIIDDGGEKIRCENHRRVVVQPIDRRIVSGFHTHHYGRILGDGQVGQHFFQVLRPDFAGATQALSEAGQLDVASILLHGDEGGIAGSRQSFHCLCNHVNDVIDFGFGGHPAR